MADPELLGVLADRCGRPFQRLGLKAHPEEDTTEGLSLAERRVLEATEAPSAPGGSH
jgi:hypothetical protein